MAAGTLVWVARCVTPAVRAGPASSAGTMDLHPAACTLLETKVSLASLGQELTLSVEMVGRHKGADVAMDVPGHLVSDRENQRRQCVVDSEANWSTSAVPYLLHIASTTSGWSRRSPDGGFWRERKSATVFCGSGRYIALRLEK